MALAAKFILASIPALIGCGMLTEASSQSGTNPGGKATGSERARFEAIAAILDNPQQTFSKAGYTPVFTATPEEAKSRLPKGLSAMPKQARTWEPWFRNAYTIKGKPVDTARQFEIKSAIVRAASKDPSLAFNPPLDPTTFISNMLKVESQVLKDFGVSQQDTVARQIARLDIAAGWVMGRRNYGTDGRDDYLKIERATGKDVDLGKLLSVDRGLTCAYAITSMIYTVREMEKKSPAGVTVGGLYVFKFESDGGRRLHGVVGALLNLPNGQIASLYYDPTPISNIRNPSVYDLATRFGPTSQPALEHFANTMSIAVLPHDKTLVGSNINHVSYTYTLNENWGPKFGLGNFDASAVPSYGDYTGGFPDYLKGAMPFKAYKLNNRGPVNLENALRRELQGL